MKVCMLSTSFPAYKGHIQSPFIYSLAKALADEHVELHVVAPGDLPAQREETLDKIHVHRFFYFFPKRWQKLTKQGGIPSNLKASFIAKLQFPLFFLSFLLRARKHVKRCDVVHAQWSFSALVGVLLKKWYKKPLILTERGASSNLALGNPIMHKVHDFILRNCDYITANNESHIATFLKEGVSKSKLRAIPNGVDITLFKPQPQATARKQLGLPKDQTTILFVGWLIKRKGVDYLLRALPAVIKKHKNVHCYLAGEGIEESALRQLVTELSLENHVTFLGAQKQYSLPAYLNAADVLVLPSHSEGRPNVVGEAIACETPVVATDVNGTKEFFNLVHYGKLVPPAHVEKLAQAINDVLSKPPQPTKFKQQLTTFRKQLTWKHSAQSYITLYKKLHHD